MNGLPCLFLSAAQVTLSWYNEIKNYRFAEEDPICCGRWYFVFKPEWQINWYLLGHFSQLIWQSTTAMGMGIAESADGRTVVVVAHYQPQGNCIGQWSANVPRLLHGTPHAFTLAELSKFISSDRLSLCLSLSLWPSMKLRCFVLRILKILSSSIIHLSL